MVSWKVTLSHIEGYIGASVRTEEVFPLDFWAWSYRAESAAHSLAEDLAGFVSPFHLQFFGGERVAVAWWPGT